MVCKIIPCGCVTWTDEYFCKIIYHRRRQGLFLCQFHSRRDSFTEQQTIVHHSYCFHNCCFTVLTIHCDALFGLFECIFPKFLYQILRGVSTSSLIHNLNLCKSWSCASQRTKFGLMFASINQPGNQQLEVNVSGDGNISLSPLCLFNSLTQHLSLKSLFFKYLIFISCQAINYFLHIYIT